MASKITGKGKILHELRIHLCPNGSTSQGARNFIQEHYANLKKQLPDTPILIREARGIEPKIWARYEFGKEQCIVLSNQNSSSIMSNVKQLIV
ncbi:ndufa2, NADH:ubiquinone oxidoreductase 10.5kD subunit [Dermatophagoides farinae]|uniref:NADH dehydrogenase [ubiquinone] 1 alpha subcomplex subunit 2 n=1 Tax=Dermatophagoides farinae TaxID=6954 RepID=A0A922I6L3_DERFA|nr:NADH dehydrogenase [ubiquinone] 1 alpha subcomplex subunit 2-like [Dermatophagoides farinae]KAH7640483.1 mitochondrial ribosomal protein l51-like protein [Dermatophagoides farinae]KAH9525931.1 ndufa2, NADH:ubiquinone oxidoreductase 10.5kD subunit [Dermatophagoides farinae]